MTKKLSSETNLPWWKKGVIYQIYPRSFNDTSGNGIGDLKGISEKISYLSLLGVDAIWLSPVFTSPMKDMGYDVSNYTDIDPLFGNILDFEKLIKKAKENKIKVIIDQVLSHSSDTHPFLSSVNQIKIIQNRIGTSGLILNLMALLQTIGFLFLEVLHGNGIPVENSITYIIF